MYIRQKIYCQNNLQRGFGRSKYIDKQYSSNANIIYSRNTYQSALQKCCTFLHYCKENFKVRNLSDIQPRYFTQFVKDNGYKPETAEGYKWAVQRLQKGFNAVHSTNRIWTNKEYLVNASKQVVKDRVQMPVSTHDKIIKNAYSSKYTNGLAFDIARTLGLRVSEITNLRMNNFEFDKSNNLKAVYIYRSKRREA